MNDYAILFLSILMILVFAYRIVLSVLFLTKKRYLLDEKYYITLFYCSLVGILVLFTKWFIAGFILLGILPVILTLYVALWKYRIYWIINGFDISESTFVNELTREDERFKNTNYRISKIKIFRKIKENRTKIEFEKTSFEEKEKLLKIIEEVCKEHTQKANKKEILTIVFYSFLTLLFSFFIILALFIE